jgi:cytochrome c oxidase subunit IV
MEFQDGFPDYEKLAQHSDAEGGGKRKQLMNVFWLLLVVTLIEVGIGFIWPKLHGAGISKTWLIIAFVGFTVLKAGYIVMSFMHLGHENKLLRWSILAPYSVFALYLLYMTGIQEGLYTGEPNHRSMLDPVKQIHQSSTSEQGGHH